MRALLRNLRDHPVAGAAIRFPFEQMRRVGAPLPHRIYKHLPHHGTFAAQCDDRVFQMAAFGDQLENAVYWRGALAYEPESTLVWYELAKRARVVFDVGANTGLFSLMAAAANPAASVHTFEPVARIAAKARTNVGLNPSMRISVHECAVGEQDGVAPIFDPGGENCYSASLDANFLAQRDGKTSYEVSVRSLDSFVKSEGLDHLDLIKLDVEGFEAQALRGARDTIRRHKPVLFVEFVRDASGELKAELDRLIAEGFELFHLYVTGPRPTALTAAGGDGRNLLLIHPEGWLKLDRPGVQ